MPESITHIRSNPNTVTPTLFPAMATTAIFFNLAMGVGWRLYKHKFQVYGYLLAFSFLRFLAYALRTLWAKNLQNYAIYLTSQIRTFLSLCMCVYVCVCV